MEMKRADIYLKRQQVDWLVQEVARRKLAGDATVSSSSIIREALDEYIQRHDSASRKER